MILHRLTGLAQFCAKPVGARSSWVGSVSDPEDWKAWEVTPDSVVLRKPSISVTVCAKLDECSSELRYVHASLGWIGVCLRFSRRQTSPAPVLRKRGKVRPLPPRFGLSLGRSCIDPD